MGLWPRNKNLENEVAEARGRVILEGRPYRKCVRRAHVHENWFSRPQGAFTYTPPFSCPLRRFHDFHVHSWFFHVDLHTFSRTYLVFTAISCFHAHTLFSRTHRHFRVHLAKRTLDTFFVFKWFARICEMCVAEAGAVVVEALRKLLQKR